MLMNMRKQLLEPTLRFRTQQLQNLTEGQLQLAKHCVSKNACYCSAL